MKSVVIRNDGNVAMIRQPGGRVLKVERGEGMPPLNTEQLEKDFDWRKAKEVPGEALP